jgi:xylulokinase
MVISHMITQATQSAVLGCDIGTQSTKGILLSESGTVIASAVAPHRVTFPAAGWAEQDATDWINAVSHVVSTLARAAQGPVTHIGISAQVDGVVAVDRDLRAQHPALIWMDRRAVSQARTAADRVGLAEIYAITGLNCDAGHSAPKMRWLLDRLAAPPRYLLSPASMVTAWLSRAVAQDHANATSSMLYDINQRAWSPLMLDAFEIESRVLPEVVDATTEIGVVRRHIAASLGLSEGCVVIAGTGDDHAGAVGAGAVTPGLVVDVTGTAEPIGTTAHTPVLDPDRLVEVHAHAVANAYFIENPGFVSGGSVAWAAGILGVEQAEVLRRAANAKPGSDGLVFVPALSGSMTPRWNAHARGSLTGLTMEHGRDEISRAVLEGCSYATRDVVDRLHALGLAVDEIRVAGGGGRSSTWMQIKADVTGRPARTVRGEASATGAACLAAVAAGWYPDVPAASHALVSPDETWYEPDPRTEETYASGYRRYRLVFDALEHSYETP